MRSNEPERDDWEEQLIDYALGTMAPQAAAEFARRLGECDAQAGRADEYAQVVEALGWAIPPAEPPAGHKARLMARLAVGRQVGNEGATAHPSVLANQFAHDEPSPQPEPAPEAQQAVEPSCPQGAPSPDGPVIVRGPLASL